MPRFLRRLLPSFPVLLWVLLAVGSAVWVLILWLTFMQRIR